MKINDITKINCDTLNRGTLYHPPIDGGRTSSPWKKGFGHKVGDRIRRVYLSEWLRINLEVAETTSDGTGGLLASARVILMEKAQHNNIGDIVGWSACEIV